MRAGGNIDAGFAEIAAFDGAYEDGDGFTRDVGIVGEVVSEAEYIDARGDGGGHRFLEAVVVRDRFHLHVVAGDHAVETEFLAKYSGDDRR